MQESLPGNSLNGNDYDSVTKLEESIGKVPKTNSHIWIAGDMNLPGLIGRQVA